MHQQVRSTPISRLAASFSRILPPPVVLLVLMLAAALKAGLGMLEIVAVCIGTVVLPGALYKGFPWLSRRFGMPLGLRTAAVSVLIVSAAATVAFLQIPHPVFATLASFIAGNLMLGVSRVWMNASAHVSVLTFSVLWWVAVFGPRFIWLLVLSPLMLLSRTALGEHTWAQALVGAAIGVATFGCFLGLSNWSLTP